MTSFGSSRLMVNTPRPPHTSCNSLDSLNLACTRLFGKLGLPPRRSTMLGWPSKIGFGRRTACGSVIGRIVGFAHYASKPKKQTTTFLFIAVTPREFGSFLRIDLAYKGSIQGNGEASPSKNGGPQWRKDQACTRRGWLPSLC
jgi:hypothetical protein